MEDMEALEGRGLPTATLGPPPSSCSWKPSHLEREEPTGAPDLVAELPDASCGDFKILQKNKNARP